MTTETWVRCDASQDYDVSDLGNVRSWLKPGTRGQAKADQPKLLKPWPQFGGYLCVYLHRRKYQVSHLVLRAFVGPRPFPRAEARHDNGDHTDNRATNLLWGTHGDNERDKVRHGTKGGSRCNLAKLSRADAWEALVSQEPSATVANRFGVNVATINRIRRRATWKTLA